MANARWNIKTGAARSGKTYLDYYVIPREIRRRAHLEGLVVLLGYTLSTIRRNVLEPLRELWGDALVGDMNHHGEVMLFGERVHCIGAEKISAADKLRGACIKYCYGDEITTWNYEVFQMLKSRLDKPYARFDGTCNPAAPSHWLKTFLDSDADLFHQSYTIYDNPFLDSSVVRNLENEYRGSVYFDRFILGKWQAAAGLIYRPFLEQTDALTISHKEAVDAEGFLSVGVDFGGNRSLTAFTAVKIHPRFHYLTAVADHHVQGQKGDIDASVLSREFLAFLLRLKIEFPNNPIRFCFCDNEAQYLVNTLRRTAAKEFSQTKILDCHKAPITERIAVTNALFSAGRLRISQGCTLLKNGLAQAVWDQDAADNGKDVRLDNGSSDIDILDAFEYAFSRYLKRFTAVSLP